MADLTTPTSARPFARSTPRPRAPQRPSRRSCCGVLRVEGSSCCGSPADEAGVFGSGLYAEGETEGATERRVGASLGCGVPTAVADLHEGETVLDLGSGAGADVLISARRVGRPARRSGST